MISPLVEFSCNPVHFPRPVTTVMESPLTREKNANARGLLLATSLSVCVSPVVSVGGRGGGALHSSGSAPDPAALQSGGEASQECLPVPQKALLPRACVSIFFSPHLSSSYIIGFSSSRASFSTSISCLCPIPSSNSCSWSVDKILFPTEIVVLSSSPS